MEPILVEAYSYKHKMSEWFTYGEMIKSKTAIRNGIENEPNELQYDNLKNLSQNCQGFFGRARPRRYGRQKTFIAKNRTYDLLNYIEKENGYPCIFFAFGRKRCEILAEKTGRISLLTKEEKHEVISLYEDYLQKMNIRSDRTAQKLAHLLRKGIAFHHAGMLPPLKEIIERLFTRSLIKLIFTTETFALGINMPARSVVFDELRKFYGHAFDYLTTRDFFQMAGRSGRRGMDKIGYVYSRVNPNRIRPDILRRIILSPPEKVRSQFNTTYAVLLNLYQKMGEDLLEIYPKSFHFFQTRPKEQSQAIASIRNKVLFLKDMGYIDKKGLTSKGIFASRIYGYELPLSELFLEGFFENSNDEEIACVLSAITFEPRKGYEFAPLLPDHIHEIRQTTRKLSKDIAKVERRFQLNILSPKFHYHLSPSIIDWINGKPFEELPALNDVDEGEIVRNFRMVIQLARELLNAEGCSPGFYDKIGSLLRRIKRDVVDAEKQLSTS